MSKLHWDLQSWGCNDTGIYWTWATLSLNGWAGKGGGVGGGQSTQRPSDKGEHGDDPVNDWV